MSERSLPHLDDQGRASMVDVTHKASTQRMARAGALLIAPEAVRDALMKGELEKGEALSVARIAGVMAAKRTGDLIPLCHPLALTDVQVHFAVDPRGVRIEAIARCTGPTGVEMEAMSAVSVAGLTLYDMAKGRARGMTLTDVRLLEKVGGKSGHWVRDDDDDARNTSGDLSG